MLESLKDEVELMVQGDVTAFLGIEFKCLPTGAVQTKQQGLIGLVLKTTGLQDCTSDKYGPEFAEQWWYSSVVGMLLYLVAYSWPEIAYAVHKCA